MTPTLNETIGVLGCGVMGQALARGILSRNVVSSSHLFLADPYTPFEKLSWIIDSETQWTRDNIECINTCQILILAVKPYQLDALFDALDEKKVTVEGKLVISLVSGYTLERLHSKIQSTHRIARVMPNTSALIGESATAISGRSDLSSDDFEIVKTIFSAVGRAWIIPEKRMNIWTAVAGAGPAYVFQFIEAMADAAVAGGIPREVANQMAAQTLLGASKRAFESKEHVALLKDQVCSPAGVTIVGVRELHKKGFTASVLEAIEAAMARYDQVEADPNI